MKNSILKIENIAKSHFFEKVSYMYDLFGEERFPEKISIPNGFQELIEKLYDFHGQNIPVIDLYDLESVKNNNNNNKVLLGYSGGLDSSYLAFYLRDNGYDVTLMHLKGLNKAYPKEDIFSKNFAYNNGFEYIEVPVKHNMKQFFIDNPLKNQLILSLMIDYGIEHDISTFALGADWCTGIENSVVGMTITDSIEVNKLFWNGVKHYFKNANLLFIDSNTKKYDRLKYLINNHNESLNDIYSCIVPHRFNSSLHEKNQIKFNVNLLNGRCGSCYKCCMEILLLSELGYMYDKERDAELIKHCWKVLSDSKNSHGKDKFNKKLPLSQRMTNLMNYGS